MQGGDGGDEVSIKELASNLSTYKDQLHEVLLLLIYVFIYIICVSIQLGFILIGFYLTGSTN